LILAGGGMKVGFQAGVLEVWLDEAGITFDHADGASGGCFNLAMYCQGMPGKQIADNWRTLDPFLPIDLNLEHYWRLAHAPSLFTYDGFRDRVLPFWGIDWQKIRGGNRLGTFNVLNFSAKKLEVVPNSAITEDLLIGAVSLPMWFPPVEIEGQKYIDAVFITDANLEEAIRRGADEIWAIWTVSTKDEWRGGFLAQYFHIIEAIADTHFFTMWKRIERSNQAIAAGGDGEFGRSIELKLLQAEVPVHYLFNLSRDRMVEAVNLGVKTARDWCQRNGVALARPGASYGESEAPRPRTKLRFTEEMRGYAALGTGDPAEGSKKGKEQKRKLAVHLTIAIDDLDRFITEPDHQASATGWVESPLFGGRRQVDEGIFNLFVHDDDPARKQMRYRLFFTGDQGQPYTLTGVKNIHDDGGLDVWADTTTLYVKLWQGRVEAAQETGMPAGAGIIRILWQDFLQQLTTFRTEGPTLGDRIAALNRFGQFFFGKIWDVFLRRFADHGPI
jgi:predicted acylesterase/phospholipase RssA